MKKLFKLSATALIIAGASLFSQSALACSSTDFACQQQQQIQWQLQNDPNYCHYGYNPNCGNGGGSYGGGYNGPIYQRPYLTILADKDGNFYFYKSINVSPYPNMTESDWLDIAKTSSQGCEFDKKSPCRYMTSVINTGCIAYLKTPAMLYSEGRNTCGEAKQAVNDLCMARYNDPKICKGIKTKKP